MYTARQRTGGLPPPFPPRFPRCDPLCRFYENRLRCVGSWGVHLVLIEVAHSLFGTLLGNWGAAAPLAPLRPSLRHCGAGCLLPLGVALCGSALPRPERFLVCLAGVSIYVLLAPSSRPMGGARICGASCARGPPPRACWLGGPPPLLAFPAPFGRAPPRWSGLWESGVRLRRAFLSATALGGGSVGGVSLGAPPCVRVPRPLAAPYRSRLAPVSAPQRVRGARL